MSTLTQYAFKLTHPVLYAQTLVIQADEYSTALQYAQDHCTGTDWSISQVKDLRTGAQVQNG